MLKDKVEGDSFFLTSLSKFTPPAGRSLFTVAAGLSVAPEGLATWMGEEELSWIDELLSKITRSFTFGPFSSILSVSDCAEASTAISHNPKTAMLNNVGFMK